MQALKLLFTGNIYFLSFFICSVFYSVFLNEGLLSNLFDVYTFIQVTMTISIMRLLIMNNALPHYLLKSDSEYSDFAFFKNAEDTIFPAAVFSFLTLFSVVVLNASRDSVVLRQALSSVLLSNLYINIFYSYYISQESQAVFKTEKSSLILSNQYEISFYLTVLTQVCLLSILYFMNNSVDSSIFLFLKKVPAEIISANDSAGNQYFIGNIIIGLIVSIIYKIRFKNQNIAYSTAVSMNLVSLSLLITSTISVLKNSDGFSNLPLQFFSLLKNSAYIQIISILLMFTEKIRNRKSKELYIKPVHYFCTKKISYSYTTFAVILFIGSYIYTGMSLFQLSAFLILVVVINILSIRRRQNIDRLIASRTLELEEQNIENERLLLNILPGSIADRLKKGEDKIADYFESVSVLFADIVGFTKLAQTMSSLELVNKLNEIFSAFDQSAEKLKIEKIKTIGDCYMAVAGIPEKQSDHAEIIIKLGIEMLEIIRNFNEKYSMDLSIRIGLNSGEVVAGVIGEHKFIYDLWGDAVNTASRMESHGIAGKIHLTNETYELVKDKFNFVSRGVIEVKGKGKMSTYILET